MLDYEQSIIIDAPADLVFGFVSNLNNLPKYLPALSGEELSSIGSPSNPSPTLPLPSGGGSQTEPVARGHECDAAGFFRVQPAEYFMEWCSETGMHCSGWLEVDEFDDSSEVTVHLSFHPDPSVAAAMRSSLAEVDAQMAGKLAGVMSTIKQFCEESSAASSYR